MTSRPGTKGVPRQQREHQILDIATTEFGSRGYAYTSLTDIATLAGVSKPLIYTYFGSRDGLHAACVHRAGRILVDAVESAQTVAGAHNKALATLTAIFHALDGHTQNWKLIYDASLPRPSEAHTLARQYQDALNTMGARGVAEALTDNDTHETHDTFDHSLLLALWFSTVSTTINWWGDHPTQTPRQMSERCLRLIDAIRRPTTVEEAPTP
ncbi:TetR/AcrR family transcriptional regulator [Streptomyces sp. SID13031]|uniref:TetR/AcrR family transcriptional regulator n=1 Tax=Streptomyces sp. SID13031 TaxID=2706046 RepID=UPI0013C9563C|nr:TetR/AcrR family transcriptional regulator [Streptomyces sp. SID13031]NEA30725.1 TetR/AcrR family transcriptional regulator [Streptomyces sp. SID13031]